MTSAFIIQVDSQLKPDSGDETTALLRVLIYEINKTAFGNNVPTLPQWTGPPPTMVHVQAILFASLVVSLFSAFLEMLGKQWLNRYASSDVRGSAAERSHNRQRKLDGIIAWYFDHVMESLPLMLQVALLLLSCAFSRYLWNISITVASVVVGVTSLGITFYLFIVVAGAVFESCPYQTPASRILCRLGPKVWNTLRSALRDTLSQSQVIGIIVQNAETHHPWRSRRKIIPFLGTLFLLVPLGFFVDVYRLGRAAIRALPPLPAGVYHLVRNANSRLHFAWKQRLETTPSNFRCITWTLQTSLDKPIHQSALEHLVTITEFTGLDPALVMDCFNVFAGCVSVSGEKLVVMQGFEQLATVSAKCFLHTFHHLWATDPTSSVLADLCHRYTSIFPFWTDLGGFPSHHTIMMIHALAHKRWFRCFNLKWDDYRPSGQEHVPFARHVVEVAQVEYRRRKCDAQQGNGMGARVPRWSLRFALHFLSLDHLPPTSVIADCLTIVAIDLDCDISISRVTAMGKRYA